MEHWKELMIICASTILFCMGITILMMQAKDYLNLLNLVKESTQEQVLYRSTNTDSESNSVNLTSYEEVIATLMIPLEYDIRINEIYIEKYSFETHLLDDLVILDTNYKKTYHYRSNGECYEIEYTSVY